MIVVKRVTDSSMYDIACRIRIEVFVHEQGVPEEIEMDEYDASADHVVAFRDDKPAGCGRVVILNGSAKIGRVAVIKDERKKGIGRKICEELIKIAAEKGIKEFVLNSQLTAADFYKKLGFEAVGGIFKEAGIDHVKMLKRI
ncbi:MAG TPA: GNAT family N-acetyltransferase [Clostridia bacterium]